MPLLRKRRNGTYILDKRKFLVRLKNIIGFRPSDITLYEKAFIHRSATHILEDGTKINNERLEFLGDAVLDTVLSDLLFRRFKDADEGELTKIRSRIVNREVLNKVALSMGIDTLLVSHTNRKNIGKNIYGDALEALIGSIFMDRGYNRTSLFIKERLIAAHLNLDQIITTERDHKSQVFQWAQKLNKKVGFNHTEECDPESKKSHFSTTLLIDHEIFGEGIGQSKKEAEQEASLMAWTKIQKIGFID